jgi:ankyrin repeat protein
MNTLINLPTRGDIKQALRNLAKGIEGLDQTYKQAMERIEGQGEGLWKLAKRILAWIIHAKRPLSTVELQYALAVRPPIMKLDKDYLPSTKVLRSICAGLVTVDEESAIIRLVHYTTQKYLMRTQRDWFPNAEADIVKTCVTYLSFDAFNAGFCLTNKEFETRLQLNPLYDYAARNWGYHARTASTEVEQLILDLLESEVKVSASSQAMMASNEYRHGDYSQAVPKQMTGVHLAACFGLTQITAALLKKGYQSDYKDSYGRTPLSWAAGNGHEAVVKLLLEKGAELESKDNYGQTPLSLAARYGHEAVVKLLLEKGAELKSKSIDRRTPLSRAAGNGHEAVVKLLLEKGAALESKKKDSHGRTPLWWAAENGHEAVVKLLLEKGVKLESKDKGKGYGQTPLLWAAKNGREAVVKLLLEKGAKLESKFNGGEMPLWWAAENGHEVVVKLLIEKGAELESKNNSGRTPLSWAAENGHEVLVRLLRSHDHLSS